MNSSTQTELHQLINLGNTSINWLRAVGINNYAELQSIGPVEAYTKIKARGFRVSKVLLYALYGALHNQHWNDVEPETKSRLLTEAEKKLQQFNHSTLQKPVSFSGQRLSR